MNELLVLVLLCVTGYLLGSIPFGLLLTKFAGLGDIRATGSGNIGATNVLRTGNKKIAALTLLLDMLKGTLAMVLAMHFLPTMTNHAGDTIPCWHQYFVAAATLLGHIFPLWLRGKGGKGVATYFGILLGISPFTFLIAITNWLGLFYTKRISSLSALFSIALVPLWLFIFTDIVGTVAGILFAILIFYTHRSNIKRLLSGTEPPFNPKEKMTLEEDEEE